MRTKIRPFIRSLIITTAFAAAIMGYVGVGLQVIAIVVFLTAYRKKAAQWLCDVFEPHEATPQTEAGRDQTSYHEAGHAVVGWVLPGAYKPRSASIIPNGEENGSVRIESRSGDPPDLQAALEELASWFAGAAAEEEFGKRSNAGCAEDLARATSWVQQMVCEWGFSGKLPRRSYDGESGLLTGEILTVINAEMDRFLADGEALARKTVKEHRDTIGCVAALLRQHGTLDESQLRAAIESRTK